MAGVHKGGDYMLREPCVERGRFKVLPRNDAEHPFVVYDPERPMAERGVALAKTLEEATRLCEAAAIEAGAWRPTT